VFILFLKGDRFDSVLDYFVDFWRGKATDKEGWTKEERVPIKRIAVQVQ
jgi:hypothetical protein